MSNILILICGVDMGEGESLLPDFLLAFLNHKFNDI